LKYFQISMKFLNISKCNISSCIPSRPWALHTINSSDLRESREPTPTRPGQGGHVPACGHPPVAIRYWGRPYHANVCLDKSICLPSTFTEAASIFLRSGCPWKTGSPGLTGEAAASLWIRHWKHLRLSLRNMLIIILLLFNSYCLCNLAFWLQYLNKLTYLLTYLLTY